MPARVFAGPCWRDPVTSLKPPTAVEAVEAVKPATKPKRARHPAGEAGAGQFVGDNPDTQENEAWEG
jgi:hypothetical protein